MLIEIRGVQFNNKGAYLMLQACLEQIAKLWPTASVALAPSSNSPYILRSKLGVYQKIPLQFKGLHFHQLAWWLPKRLKTFLKHNFGFVFESDVDLVLDASGFAYGDQWGGRAVRSVCAEVLRLKRHQSGYIFLPQAMGPFTRKDDQQALTTALPEALLVCPRDDASLNFLQQCSQSATIQQFADFTNLVKADVPQNLPENYALIIPNSAMTGRQNNHKSWHDRYLPVLTDAILAVEKAGLLPVVLNHEGPADRVICEQLKLRFPDIHVVAPALPAVVKGWISRAQIVISSRFHGCVSALSSGVPCIGTSWSHKYEMLFAEYHQSGMLLSPSDGAEQIFHSISKACDTENQKLLFERADYWRSQSEQLWQTIQQTVADAIDSGVIQLKDAG